MHRVAFLALVICFVSPPVSADMFGLGDAKIIVQLVNMYKEMKRQLEVLKSQNESLKEIQGLYDEASTSYKTVVNADIQDVKIQVEKDLGKLLELDEGHEYSVASLLRSNNGAEGGNTPGKAALPAGYQTITSLFEIVEKNLQKTATDIKPREAAQLQSQSQAIMSLLNIYKTKNELLKGVKQARDAERLKETKTQQDGIYRAMGKSDW